MRPLLFLYLAGSALGLAGVPDPKDLLHGLCSPSISGWAIADFDGDSKMDVATAHSAHDAGGYAQEVFVGLSASPQTSFTFRSRFAKVRLSVRDIDGDHDRDIVILEALSLEPIGVWLNDGEGNFTEGNLEDFRTLLSHGDPASLFCPELGFKVWFAIPEQRVQTAVLRSSMTGPDPSVERLAVSANPVPRNPCQTDLRSRAPPCTN